MAPSSAAAAASRIKLISVASFGLIAGVCAFVGYYYLLRQRRKSPAVSSTGTVSEETKEEETSRDRKVSDESKHTETVSETAKESPDSREEHETGVETQSTSTESQALHSESENFGTNEAKETESKKTETVEDERDRDLLRDESTSGHASKRNNAKSNDSDRSIINGDTLPGRHKVFSAGVTHFLDETTGESSTPELRKGNHKTQKQDTWSETVIVGGKESLKTENEDSTDGHGSEKDKRRSGTSDVDHTGSESDPEKERKLETHIKAGHKETGDKNLELPNATDNESGDQSEGRTLETEKLLAKQFAAAADDEGMKRRDGHDSSAEETTFHGVGKKQLTTHDVRSKKSSLPTPLTPPPDSGPSRRPRARGGQRAPAASDRALNVEDSGSRSRQQRWSPLEDKAADNVQLDAGAQQASWTTSRPNSASSNTQSPWTPTQPKGGAVFGDSTAKVEFDDNFVDAVSTQSDPEVRPPTQGSPMGCAQGGAARDIGSLLQATPECVLERKPLISEDEEDEENANRDGHQFTEQSRKKLEQKGVNDASKHKMSKSTEETKKLVKIDENCIDSLIKLARENDDSAVRLATVRALVNLSWTTEKHHEYTPIIDQLFENVDNQDAGLRLESLRVLANLSKNPDMVPYLLAAKAPGCLLKLLTPELDDEVLTIWLSILDDILWTSKEMCLTYASLPIDHRAASPETVYTGLYGLKNSRILKSKIFVLSRHRSQQVTYLASRIYSCLTS